MTRKNSAVARRSLAPRCTAHINRFQLLFFIRRGLQVVRPVRTSQIESSHRRPVADLRWISCDSEIGPKGGRRTAKEDKECHQLVTVASDGAMCVADALVHDGVSASLT